MLVCFCLIACFLFQTTYYRNADNVKCWCGTVVSDECFETNLISVHVGLLYVRVRNKFALDMV